MGLAYVLWVHDDAVRDAHRDAEQSWKWKLEVGEAVLELCRPRMSRRDVEIRSRPVRNHSNGVNLAGQGEVHSTSEQIYLWSRNCLRASYELSLEELEIARDLVNEKIAERKAEAVAPSE